MFITHPVPTLQRTLLALSLAVAFATPALAADDDARINALERKLEQSLSVIQKLQDRVAELEQRAPATASASAPPAAPATTAADTAARVEAVERQVNDLAVASTRQQQDGGVPVHGFMDVMYQQRGNNSVPSGRNGTRVGTMDLYLTPQISDRVKALAEIDWEYNLDSGQLGTDVERMQLGYTYSDALTLWAGRFHTPYGYWNTAYHHGAQLQTSILRPNFIAFEDSGGILPAHTVGLWATGRTSTAAGKFEYDVYAGNGDQVSNGILDFQGGGGFHNSLESGFRASLSPDAVPGLTLGLHGLREGVTGTDITGTQQGTAEMQFLGGYVYFENDNWELISEYYNFRDKDVSGGKGILGSWASYAQLSRVLGNQLTGYVRWERAALNQGDPYFSLQEYGSSYSQVTAGVRYDLDPRSAVKVQFDHNRSDLVGGVIQNWVRLQYAVRF